MEYRESMFELLEKNLKEVLPTGVSAEVVAWSIVGGSVLVLVVAILWVIVRLVRLSSSQESGVIIYNPPAAETGNSQPEMSAANKDPGDSVSSECSVRADDDHLSEDSDEHDSEPNERMSAGVAKGHTVLDEDSDYTLEVEEPHEYGDISELPELTLLIPQANGRVKSCQLQPEVLKDFPGQVVLIGRSKEAQLRFSNNKVSARHLHLGADTGGYWVKDIGSSNGTLLNGEPCVPGQQNRVKDGDELVLGDARLMIQIKG